MYLATGNTSGGPKNGSQVGEIMWKCLHWPFFVLFLETALVSLWQPNKNTKKKAIANAYASVLVIFIEFQLTNPEPMERWIRDNVRNTKGGEKYRDGPTVKQSLQSFSTHIFRNRRRIPKLLENSELCKMNSFVTSSIRLRDKSVAGMRSSYGTPTEL